MKVYFRVDSSLDIGSGHVTRCLALAHMLQNYGNVVVFVMRPQAGDMCGYIANHGFNVERLPQPNEWLIPKNTADYQAWLQVPLLQDAEDFLSVAADADLVLIDHYGINADWESVIKSRISCHLVAIDDLVREHHADLIIDQTLGRTANEYKRKLQHSVFLTGTSYALLNRRFSELHPVALEKERTPKTHRLLLTMGAVDNPNGTLQVLKALSHLETLIDTTVLLSPHAPHFDSVVLFSEQNSDWVTHIPFSHDMAALMLEHTVGIGAPGSTSWERSCMGLPSIVVPLADNQRDICQNLVREKAAMSLTLNEIPRLLTANIDNMFTNFERMREKNLYLCDGKGCERVVESMRILEWF